MFFNDYYENSVTSHNADTVIFNFSSHVLTNQMTLKTLISNKELTIQKVHKGNTVVLRNRKDYIFKMKLILADTSKFKKIQIDDSKVLNHLIKWKIKLLNFSKNLNKKKKKISDEGYNDLYPTGSRPGIL